VDGGLPYRLLIDLMLPPGSLVAALLVGLLMARRWPRAGRAVLWGATICLYLVSTPLVSDRLVGATGDYQAFEPSARGGARAIVILAGEKWDAPEYGGDTVGKFTLARVRLGARIARQTGLPLLVSGGKARPADAASIAELMQRTLRDEFQTPARWLEEQSHDTRENAVESARILHGEHIDTIVLVTHYSHMRRAATLFEAQGLHVIPAPTDLPARNPALVLGDFPPGYSSLEDSALALHELIAQALSRIETAATRAARPGV
jgi:uncharacterized SAM-binding protein YcdF (DUF218 family)